MFLYIISHLYLNMTYFDMYSCKKETSIRSFLICHLDNNLFVTEMRQSRMGIFCFKYDFVRSNIKLSEEKRFPFIQVKTGNYCIYIKGGVRKHQTHI